MRKRTIKKYNNGGNLLSGAAAGFSAGAKLAPFLGPAAGAAPFIGAAVGFGASAIQQNKEQELIRQQRDLQYQIDKENAEVENSNILQSYPTKGVKGSQFGYGKYGMKLGKKNSLVSKHQSLPDGGKLIKGDSHNQDTDGDGKNGVPVYENGEQTAEVEGGEVEYDGLIFSKRLASSSGGSYADTAKQILESPEYAEFTKFRDKNTRLLAKSKYDKYSKGTAERNLSTATNPLEVLFQEQEQQKAAIEQQEAEGGQEGAPAMAYGGDLKDPIDPPKPIYVDSANDPRYQAYSDSLTAYNEGSQKYNSVKKTGKMQGTDLDLDSEKIYSFKEYMDEYNRPDSDFNMFNTGTNSNMKPIKVSQFRGKGILGYLDYGRQAQYKKPQQQVIIKPTSDIPANVTPAPPKPYVPNMSTDWEAVLKAEGKDGSYKSRKQMYLDMGLDKVFGEYSGTAEQNLGALEAYKGQKEGKDITAWNKGTVISDYSNDTQIGTQEEIDKYLKDTGISKEEYNTFLETGKKPVRGNYSALTKVPVLAKEPEPVVSTTPAASKRYINIHNKNYEYSNEEEYNAILKARNMPQGWKPYTPPKMMYGGNLKKQGIRKGYYGLDLGKEDPSIISSDKAYISPFEPITTPSSFGSLSSNDNPPTYEGYMSQFRKPNSSKLNIPQIDTGLDPDAKYQAALDKWNADGKPHDETTPKFDMYNYQYYGTPEGQQYALYKSGFYDGPIDSIFGPKTKAAIEAFQKDAKIPITGVIDIETQRQINKTIDLGSGYGHMGDNRINPPSQPSKRIGPPLKATIPAIEIPSQVEKGLVEPIDVLDSDTLAKKRTEDFNKQQALQGAAELAYRFADNVANRKLPQVTRPTLLKSPRLKTRTNIGEGLRDINESQTAINKAFTDNNPNTGVANANIGNTYANTLKAKSKLYDSQANQEIALQNQQIGVDYENQKANLGITAKYNEDVFNKNAQDLKNSNANIANVVNDITAYVTDKNVEQADRDTMMAIFSVMNKGGVLDRTLLTSIHDPILRKMLTDAADRAEADAKIEKDKKAALAAKQTETPITE